MQYPARPNTKKPCKSSDLQGCGKLNMAEREGFEPSVQLPVRSISSRVP